MISLVAFQEAIVSLLKADASLVARVGLEIREDEWQASNFVYPCVRVGGPTVGSPFGAGGCANSCSFQIFAFSAEPSSLGCALLTDLVVSAVEEKTFVGPTIRLSTVYITLVTPPKRAQVNVWRSIIECSTIATAV